VFILLAVVIQASSAYNLGSLYKPSLIPRQVAWGRG